jgi:hypothetical protein
MEYRVKKGKAISLVTGRAKYSLRISEGIVWLTCPDDTRDYFLEKGASFDTRTDGKFVLEALSDATIVIDSVSTATVWQLMIQVTLEPSWGLPVTMGRIKRSY